MAAKKTWKSRWKLKLLYLWNEIFFQLSKSDFVALLLLLVERIKSGVVILQSFKVNFPYPLSLFLLGWRILYSPPISHIIHSTLFMAHVQVQKVNCTFFNQNNCWQLNFANYTFYHFSILTFQIEIESHFPFTFGITKD